MTLQQAIKICREMQKWKRGQDVKVLPYTTKEYGLAIDILIDAAEKQIKTSEDKK